VLPIGGLKEKLLAAHRGGITTVLIPAENEKDLAEIPANIKQNLDIRPVHWIDEVLEAALQYLPVAPENKEAVDAKKTENASQTKKQILTAH
jgi:ATP-dependent Lon protease